MCSVRTVKKRKEKLCCLYERLPELTDRGEFKCLELMWDKEDRLQLKSRKTKCLLKFR